LFLLWWWSFSVGDLEDRRLLSPIKITSKKKSSSKTEQEGSAEMRQHNKKICSRILTDSQKAVEACTVCLKSGECANQMQWELAQHITVISLSLSHVKRHV
jgi:mevalonate kinase